MNCENFKNLALSQGTLSKDEQIAFEKHSKDCAHCGVFYSEIKEWNNQTEILKQEKANPFLADKIISKLKQKETPVRTLSPVVLATFRIAAVLVIGIFSGIVLNNYLQKTTDDAGSVSAQNKTEVSVDADETNDQDNLMLTFNE